MSDAYSILRRPIITEKSTKLQESNRYVFQVARSATKIDVKLAVEKNFDVTVLNVNTITVKGKRKRRGPRYFKKPDVKKAIVTIAEGDSITLFEGV